MKFLLTLVFTLNNRLELPLPFYTFKKNFNLPNCFRKASGTARLFFKAENVSYRVRKSLERNQEQFRNMMLKFVMLRMRILILIDMMHSP